MPREAPVTSTVASAKSAIARQRNAIGGRGCAEALAIVAPMARIGNSTLEVFPLCLGGNVFGWTADEQQSFAVSTPTRRPAATSSTPRTCIRAGSPATAAASPRRSSAAGWRRAQPRRARHRDKGRPRRPPRARAHPRGRARLARTPPERPIDLYYAHYDDLETPQAETLAAFGELIDAGSVGCIGASNFTAQRLASALEIAERDGLPAYVALQPEYNLLERDYEDGLRAVVERAQLGCVPYYGLARGFLTGKWPGASVSGPRAAGAAGYSMRAASRCRDAR